MHLSPSLALLLAALSLAHALPLTKRIDQTTIDAVTPWESACTAAGGAEQCNPLAVDAAATLLAAAGPCEQQNEADKMVTLAKTLNSDADMIRLAQIFAQQPRNSPTSQAVPYCQSAPANPELNGLFQCQFAGVSQGTFVGGVAVGGNGTIPFGLSAPVSPAGSCPANPQGPLKDGVQLNTLVQDPAVGGAASSNATSSASGASATAADSATATATSTDSAATSSATSTDSGDDGSDDGDDGDCSDAPPVTVTVDPSATATATDSSDPSTTATDSGDASAATSAPLAAAPSPSIASSASSIASSLASSAPAAASTTTSATSSSPSSASGGFQAQNALAAQQMNAGFAALSANDTCTEGQQACIGPAFAQCVASAWVLQAPCAGGTLCVALPLVNKAGTSFSCDFFADAQARFADAGVSGGVDGQDGAVFPGAGVVASAGAGAGATATGAAVSSSASAATAAAAAAAKRRSLRW